MYIQASRPRQFRFTIYVNGVNHHGSIQKKDLRGKGIHNGAGYFTVQCLGNAEGPTSGYQWQLGEQIWGCGPI